PRWLLGRSAGSGSASGSIPASGGAATRTPLGAITPRVSPPSHCGAWGCGDQPRATSASPPPSRAQRAICCQPLVPSAWVPAPARIATTRSHSNPLQRKAEASSARSSRGQGTVEENACACSKLAIRPAFHSARCSCQTPRPIIVATAAATRSVASRGTRRVLLEQFGDPAATHVDDDQQQQQHYVDEVSVPRRGFEDEVLARREVAQIGAAQADDQHVRADQHVEAVEARRHVEGRTVGVAAEV